LGFVFAFSCFVRRGTIPLPGTLEKARTIVHGVYLFIFGINFAEYMPWVAGGLGLRLR
jgi:hypothetical protein